ncbi:homocysteine S-methyltransferase [Gaiella sp.]|uniref:homocysteine S-methyltransferase n=1 Tax=Gaiella sp. TaxID=2663207 RepID=UPI003266E086
MTVRIVDGGLSTALEEAGHRLDDPLWTARFLIDDPEAIVAAHLAFLRAGARVLITSSYQASETGFVAAGLAPQEAVAALRSTTALAVEARIRFTLEDPAGAADVLVAASVGPYGATLYDGSEYRAPAVDEDTLVDFHRARLHVLVDTQPDLLAIETLASTQEARAIGRALEGLPSVPAWMSFTCRDGATTWGGEPIEELVAAAAAVPSVIAVGVNCTAPNYVTPLLEHIGRVTNLPLVAYPNGGQSWDAHGKVWVGAGSGFSKEEIALWVTLGARYIGGCCGVGASGVVALRDAVDQTGGTLAAG